MTAIQTPQQRAAAAYTASGLQAEYRVERVASQTAAASNNPDSFIHIDTVCALAGLKRTSIYERMRDPVRPFPQPIRLSARCSRWRSGDVTEWLKAQYAAHAK